MIRLFLILLGLFAATPAMADNFGLSMVGEPQYSHNQAPLTVNDSAPVSGTLKQAVIGTFDTVNPYALKGTAAAGLNLIYDRLMGRLWDEPFTLYPLIAESYELGEKRDWIAFTIDKRARFADGTPITVADVRFSYETLRDKGRPNMRRVYQLVDTVKISGNKIRFNLKSGHDRETVMIIAMMPVLSQKFWQDKDFEAAILTDINSNGAYRIDKIDLGRQITLKRDPNYWAKDHLVNRGAHKFERLVFDYYRDEGIALEAFLSGNLDIRRENNPSTWRQNYPKSKSFSQIDFPHGRAEPVWSIIFNTRRAPFDDIRVRKALSLVFDAGRSNKTLFHNAYKRLDSYFPNTDLAAKGLPSPQEQALLAPYADNLPQGILGDAVTQTLDDTPANLRNRQREADQLLKEAGLTINKAGKRVNANGTPVAFEIVVGNLTDERIALVWSRALKRLGIDLSIRSLDSTSFRNRTMRYDYDTLIHLWQSSLSPGAEQLLYWGCAAKEQEGRFNYAGICNPAIDALASGLSQVSSREELQHHARALDRILQHSYIAIPLYYSGIDRWALKNTIKTPDKTPLYGAMWENWWYQKD